MNSDNLSGEHQWVTIERIFNAPVETVWKMWTDPALFQKWYGPMGMSVPVAQMDVTVGGTRKICMEMVSSEKTMQMWFIGEYKEITVPKRLVYTEAMCDAQGNILSPQSRGMPEGSPGVTEVIVELSEREGKTHMRMIHIGVPAGSGGEGGWQQAIDKMGGLLGVG